MSLGEKLYRWSMEEGFDEKTARNFFRVLGEYIETGKAPKWWIERCKELNILDEDGKFVLDTEYPRIDLILIGLTWEGILRKEIVDEGNSRKKVG